MNVPRFRGCVAVVLLVLAGSAVRVPAGEVGPVPPAVRERLKLAPFYSQHLDVAGLPVVGSSNVSALALREAGWIVSHMLTNRHDLLHTLGSNRVRLAVMAWNEFTTDVPEHSDLTPKVYWDRRARGLGATQQRPAVSGAEENLLGYPGDPYASENILVHEFAHAIHEMGLRTLDPGFEPRLRQAYHSATNRGLWRGTYAGSSIPEYWAEGVQSWFDDNRENDGQHNFVNTRRELEGYDPTLAALCAEVFRTNDWRYLKPSRRPAADRSHLAGLDPENAPRFEWRDSPVERWPRVVIRTTLGDIELELNAAAAPITTSNFLRYAQAGFYRGGTFHRTVTATNQPTNNVKIAVIQASANTHRESEVFPPIRLERTRDTKLTHRDGTVSMARLGPDTATHSFFICVGNQPELDFGGHRNPDGQGFAAFGRVVKGMELVRRIHAAPAEGQDLKPPILIRQVIRIR